MTRAPVITLTTDFGRESYYLGAMRGVLLSLCPGATLVDITHDITPFAVLEASFVLDQACRTFPPGTIHLAVVDPEVGGRREPLIVLAGSYLFVGPDNGLFTPFYDGTERLYRIREEVSRSEVSATFHGRDLFAPAAARLAAGEDPLVLGEARSHAVRLHPPRPRREGDRLVGQVLHLDRFGNLVTNVHRRDLEPVKGEAEIMVGTTHIPRLSRTYQDGNVGETLALVGSSGHLEIAVVQGNAATQLGVGRGERVLVQVR